MLNFLRKHQKIFFIVVTAAIVISFGFFGTYSTFDKTVPLPDKEVVKGVSGKPIMQQELGALIRLIESSPFDRMAMEKGGMPNFFNDGVIEKDFLANGLGVMLVRPFFETLKPDLDQRAKKIRAFRPYAHPQAPQVTVEKAWARYAPSLLEHYQALKRKSDQSTTETLALMAQVYLDQAMLPPDMLRQVLLMQQNQQGAPPDPVLDHCDLSLFGFKSMEEWFGPQFVPLVAQCIMNAAQLAEERGYEVKNEEVRADLFQNIYQAYRQFSQNESLKAEEASQYFQMKMRSLGMDEPMLLNAWRKVMLFRRLFVEGSGSVLVDPLVYRQFHQFASEGARVCLYQLPPSMRLSDFQSLLKMQIYLEAVASDPAKLRADLRLPKQFASMENIEKRVPQLVECPITVEYSCVTKTALCSKISVRETGEWEAEDAHWEMLRRQFPEVAALAGGVKQQRLAALDTLETKLRTQVDQWARSQMVERQCDKIRWALDQAEVKTAQIGLRSKGSLLPFSGVKETAELTAFLSRAALKGEIPNAANERLECYTMDKEHYYRIAVVQREAAKKVLTFQEAEKDGTLSVLLDERLEAAYPDARKKDPRSFQQANGQWKPFKEVKERVGKYAFADLLKAIEENYRAQMGILPGQSGDLPLVFYSNARWLSFMKEAQDRLKGNPDDAAWINTGEMASPFAAQWLLERTEQWVQRHTETSFSKEEMFTLAAEEWSSVKVGERGAVAFYFVKEKSPVENVPPIESVELGHQILSFDAKRDMMLHLLQRIQQKKAIDLTAALTEER